MAGAVVPQSSPLVRSLLEQLLAQQQPENPALAIQRKQLELAQRRLEFDQQRESSAMERQSQLDEFKHAADLAKSMGAIEKAIIESQERMAKTQQQERESVRKTGGPEGQPGGALSGLQTSKELATGARDIGALAGLVKGRELQVGQRKKELESIVTPRPVGVTVAPPQAPFIELPGGEQALVGPERVRGGIRTVGVATPSGIPEIIGVAPQPGTIRAKEPEQFSATLQPAAPDVAEAEVALSEAETAKAINEAELAEARTQAIAERAAKIALVRERAVTSGSESAVDAAGKTFKNHQDTLNEFDEEMRKQIEKSRPKDYDENFASQEEIDAQRAREDAIRSTFRANKVQQAKSYYSQMWRFGDRGLYDKPLKDILGFIPNGSLVRDFMAHKSAIEETPFGAAKLQVTRRSGSKGTSKSAPPRAPEKTKEWTIADVEASANQARSDAQQEGKTLSIVELRQALLDARVPAPMVLEYIKSLVGK